MRVKIVKNIVLSLMGMGLLVTTTEAMMDDPKNREISVPHHPELDYSQEYKQ